MVHTLRFYSKLNGRLLSEQTVETASEGLRLGYQILRTSYGGRYDAYVTFSMWPVDTHIGLYSGKREDIERYKDTHRPYNHELFLQHCLAIYWEKFSENTAY